MQDACAVCLMRLGQVEKAVNVLRPLLLKGNSLTLSPDAPLVYKTNHALALFLAHHVEGCMEVLKEIDDDQHPLVVKTRSAVERWRRSLGLLQRFLLLCGMQMEGRAIQLDVAPGDL